MTEEIETIKPLQRQAKTIQPILIIIGGLMMLGAPFADQLAGQLLLAGLVLFLVGLLGRRILTTYRATAVILLTTLLLFLGLELAAGTVLTIARLPPVKALLALITGKPNDLVAHYLALPYYAEQEWASRYWQEQKLALKKTYHPYVIWRSPAFTGETLNIDQDGIRHTPAAECVPNAYKVFVFGGSVMWGWGAPDWGTIPAYLQAGLRARRNEPVCVVNFAENAYVSTQSLIQLQLQLGAGQVPDVVIFYDGVNEVLAASQTGQPILHQSFTEIATLFQYPQHPLVTWLQGLSSFQLLQKVMLRIGVYKRASHPYVTVEAAQLSDAVAKAYLGNHKIVSSLAKTYQFDCYFFWQPYILVGHKPLTSEEQNMLTGLNWVLNLDPALINLFTATYNRIELEASASKHLYSLAQAFDGVESQLWIDTWGHVTPEGNRLVAQKMLAVIEN